MQLNQNNKLDNGKNMNQWENKFEKDTFIAGRKTSPEK